MDRHGAHSRSSAAADHATVNMEEVWASRRAPDSDDPRSRPRSGMAGLCGGSVVRFLRAFILLSTEVGSGAAPPHPAGHRVPSSPHPHQDLSLFCSHPNSCGVCPPCPWWLRSHKMPSTNVGPPWSLSVPACASGPGRCVLGTGVGGRCSQVWVCRKGGLPTAKPKPGTHPTHWILPPGSPAWGRRSGEKGRLGLPQLLRGPGQGTR